jgi:hypothetical protein
MTIPGTNQSKSFKGSFRSGFKATCILAALILSSLLSDAQGNLLITPRRVIFEGSRKSQELNLANTGQDTATYNISIIQYRMKDDGTFEQIEQPDPGQRFADPYLRFFPRSVTLPPNEAQVVKMQLIKTNELQEGEYRSHIYFRAVPNQKPLGEETNAVDSSTISVQITPIFGVTIPVIIRVGVSNTTVTLSDLKLIPIDDTLSRLTITFNRSGNFSVYGDISVNYVSPQGKTTQVGMVKGIAVYTPNTLRRFQMDLIKPKGIDFNSGSLVVTYLEQSDVKPAKIAEQSLNLP